jgi:N-acetylneuraminic acid mutarotase
MRSARIHAGLLLVACIATWSCTEPTANPDTAPPDEPEVRIAGTGAWSYRTPMPTARFWLASAVVSNASGHPIVYAIGGHDGGLQPLRRVEAYNYATNSWSRRSDLPSAGAGSGSSGAATIGGKVYVPGGNPDGRRLYVYDPPTNTWRTKAPMPIPVGSGMSAAIGEKLYVFTGSTVPYEDSARGRRLYRYDPSANTWTRRADAPDYHADGIAAAIGGKLYLMGGYDESRINEEEEYLVPSLVVSVYDPATNTWTTRSGGSQGDACSAGAAFQSKLWDLGGNPFAPDLDITGDVSAYDPKTGILTRKASMLTARCGSSAVRVVYRDVARLLVIGGFRTEGANTFAALRTVERYAP